MKRKTILVIGSLITLGLAVLWLVDIVTEPLFTIGTAILTTLGYCLTPEENKKSGTITNQKHSGSGDNVGRDKIIKN